jgi:Asp-tRNA(Asn)/Glu-tRNA(Gln) amidotransferase A subunit family amidase
LNSDEYQSFDAVGLAALVARREVSPSELLDAALTRLDEVNPAINAVIRVVEDQARAAIADGLPEGPLTGTPFLIKDISQQMKGLPTISGSRLFLDAAPAQADSALVAAYRRAGLVLFGKTNTPEFGAAATTEPVAFGATRNPWNLERTSGGSSGGAAAAVAAGIVPAAHASDGGGSIRTPASCCGLFGLKPSRGRVSNAPAGEGWGGLSVQHAVTRSVRDSATLLDVACQPQPGDPYWQAPPATPFAAEVGRDPGRLRIAFSTEALTWGTMDPACAAAVRDAAALCEALGHDVEEAKPELDYLAMAEAVNMLVSPAIATTLHLEAQRRGRPIEPGEVETLSWLIAENGGKATAVDMAVAQQKLNVFARGMAAFFLKYDVLILSTLGSPPVPLGHMDTNAVDLSDYAEKLYGFMPNTQLFNAGGQPAMSVPLGMSDDGLPIGVMFAAATGDEATLFRLAGQLETAAPWAARRPALGRANG